MAFPMDEGMFESNALVVLPLTSAEPEFYPYCSLRGPVDLNLEKGYIIFIYSYKKF